MNHQAIKDALEALEATSASAGFMELNEAVVDFRAKANPTAISALLAELEEAKRDAEAYRALRDGRTSFVICEWADVEDWFQFPDSKHIDSIVFAAINKDTK